MNFQDWFSRAGKLILLGNSIMLQLIMRWLLPSGLATATRYVLLQSEYISRNYFFSWTRIYFSKSPSGDHNVGGRREKYECCQYCIESEAKETEPKKYIWFQINLWSHGGPVDHHGSELPVVDHHLFFVLVSHSFRYVTHLLGNLFYYNIRLWEEEKQIEKPLTSVWSLSHSRFDPCTCALSV